jgi:ribonuclease Z
MHFAFLGTSASVPSATRDTTSIVVVVPAGAVLIDCGGSPVQKLQRAGIDPQALAAVVITHITRSFVRPGARPTGVLGRQAPLTIYCGPSTSSRSEASSFSSTRSSAPDVHGHRAAHRPRRAPTLHLGPLTVRTSPNDHGGMPNFAVRVDAARAHSLVYSSDTRPCDAVVALARGADTLIHDSTYSERHRSRAGGHAHSTAAEAGDVAARAGVRRLILTHIGAEYHDDVGALAEEARERFSGDVEVARELVPYPPSPLSDLAGEGAAVDPEAEAEVHGAEILDAGAEAMRKSRGRSGGSIVKRPRVRSVPVSRDDAESAREITRSAGQSARVRVDSPSPRHRREPGDRLQGADQYASRATRRAGNGVQAVVDPVVQVDVREAALTIEEPMAAGPERRVRCGVLWPEIRFRLDDSARGERAAAP